MTNHRPLGHLYWYRFYASPRRFSSTVNLLTVLGFPACDLSRPGDTTGVQSAAQWEWHGRLVVQADSTVTLVRMRIDTTGVKERHDVLLARFDFDPSPGVGDEYSIALGLDLGRARDLRINTPYPLGAAPPPPPGRIPAYATVTCLCRPVRPDSVSGTFLLATRGLRQITGRIDATLYFTAWDDSSVHVTYPFHQRIDGVK